MFVARHTTQFLIAALAIYLGACVLIFSFGIPLGIDFTGGSLTEVSYEALPEKVELEKRLDNLSLGAYSLRGTAGVEGRAGYILRTRDLLEGERKAVAAALTEETEGGAVDRFTSVGPVIGEELQDKALYALGAVFLIIILYVAFVFRKVSKPVGSWVYGGITILVLLHDVLVPAAVVAVLGTLIGIEADVLFVMALLAVLGYSVNDTIVVFDRVRENLLKYRNEKEIKVKTVGVDRTETTYELTKPFADIVGESVSQTLARSINTSLTTLLALIALFILGGSATQMFALILIVGVVAGTYSSICIASPLLIAIAHWQAKKGAK